VGVHYALIHKPQYDDCIEWIENKNCTEERVKQGDPLSPFIFSAIMDPLLVQLEQTNGFEIDESQSISALAFADDLILLATMKETAINLLHFTETYLNNLGMSIAAAKCTSFEIKTTDDSRYIANPDICLKNGNKIPNWAADSSICYLGGHISPRSFVQSYSF